MTETKISNTNFNTKSQMWIFKIGENNLFISVIYKPRKNNSCGFPVNSIISIPFTHYCFLMCRKCNTNIQIKAKMNY